MTFLHLADLHIGKRVNEVSMLEDQEYILDRIIETVKERRPDAVIIAGDVYDKPIPPAAAVELFDAFLTTLSDSGTTVCLIAGNHDSAERLAFGGALMAKGGVHLSRVFDGHPDTVTFTDEYGTVTVWLLPFIKPIHASHAYDEPLTEYTDAVRAAVAHMAVDMTARNVLVTHQFVTGASTCDSEELSVGGTDQVEVSAFDGFDYVALGHLHGPQQVSRETVRYAGSPLKYSFSEARHHKSMPFVTLGQKGDVTVELLPLSPRRDMAQIEGKYDELAARAYYDGTALRDSYLHITLTDEEDVPDAIGKLRVIYPHLMKLSYNNRRTREQQIINAAEDAPKKHPLELFAELYEIQNNQPMTEEQRRLVGGLIESIWEGDA